MTNNAVHFVIDASVTAALFINDIYTLKTRQLFDQFSQNILSVFHAPDAMYYEVLGVLRKHTLRFGYTS